ncbi:MAG: 6-phosphofructokinase [Calditrichaeota bacterium]|nr:6-phosphofructokinase [Calditrichota bacterium]
MGKKRIGILTGGGDCPGLNAVIRGVAKTAINQYGMEVVGILDGFRGMLEGRFTILDYEKVSGILTIGGTILGTDNKTDPFNVLEVVNGKKETVDKSDVCMEFYRDLGLDALICVGGDGTLTIAGKLAQKGANVIGVPKTIDNDLMETDQTFGFDSARHTATEAIDKLHTTAQSHHRVMLVEVMGRNAGWLALESGLAGGGDIILIPEIPYEIDEIIAAIRRRNRFGKRFSIIVVSEGARPKGGEQVYQRIVDDPAEPKRLGGVSNVIARQIEQATGIECRVAILGHLQRGGTPTPYDRLLATQYAVKAVELAVEKKYNHMVALKGRDMVAVPIERVMGKQRLVPRNSPLIEAAICVGTSFGVKMD